ncbi:hypothetical protein [Chryseobacterium shigense]|uniref:Uncharacterized protein n=1 Tax=Chryseobacterium shigense TaxID=297244 RepID=A0A841N6S3_9FLAO|nr:hypothetical protein [Chryseobacterium shigense]MBB6369158.1 hypothetical protein [Chryseobacterium shigense]
MATKRTIIAEIDTKIIPNGNILAKDTNKILKDILDCDELNSSGGSTDGFSYSGESSDDNGAKLIYSIRGIIGLFANFTVMISIPDNNVNKLSFPYEDLKMFESLSTVMVNSENMPDFLVKIRNSKPDKIYKEWGLAPKKYRIGCLNLRFDDKNLYFSIEGQEWEDSLVGGDSIFTSFAIHNPGIKKLK